MKNKILFGTLALASLSLASCNDFLNDNRYPLSEQVNTPEFWNSQVNVEGQINHLYNDYLGYGNGSGGGNFYFKTLSDDQIAATNGTFQTWYNTNVPASLSEWNDPYTSIRLCNMIITGVEASTFDSDVKQNYIAQARMNRAYQYYKLVRTFGDVPLVTKVLNVTDEAELYGPRTPRNTVMDFVLEDINYATVNISAQNGKTVFSKDMAQAMKAEICLFEGAYARYNANDDKRANKFFEEVVNACNAVMPSYTLCDDYQSLYNSVRVEADGIPGLTTNPEVIFMKPYENNVFMHSLLDWTSSSTAIAGITKDAFDSYLFLDGKPASQHPEASDVGELVQIGEDEKNNPIHEYSIAKLLKVRDKRLSAITNDVVYFNGLPKKYENTMYMTSSSGYGVKKYRNDKIGYTATTTANKAYTCAPIYWLAEIYLAYAEAKAELGTLNDNDLKATINKLYDRAGLPQQTVASLSAINDQANNMGGISSLLWEIRRCRRCELIMDNDIRYWDLVRWNMLELLDNSKHPNVLLGANLSAATGYTNMVKLNADGYIDASSGAVRKFTEREKLFPIPSQQRLLNKNLTQNPGWE